MAENETQEENRKAAMALAYRPGAYTTAISINADGNLNYVPAVYFYGIDSFTYTSINGRVSNQATLTLNVSHVNHTLVVTADNVAMTVTAG